jgi:signal transduction histidine kinase/ligand-binding sensor domain-containing protein
VQTCRVVDILQSRSDVLLTNRPRRPFMKPGFKSRMPKACAAILAFWVVMLGYGHALDPARKVTQYAIRTWTTDQGLPQGWISTLLQTRDGFMWVGTKGGLARFDGVQFQVFKSSTPHSIPNDTIDSLSEDTGGNLWIGTPGGLTRFRNREFVTFTALDGLPETSVWRTTPDPTGGLWIVTTFSHLIHYDGQRFREIEFPIAGRFQEVTNLLEDTDGVVWVTTFHGLFKLRMAADYSHITELSRISTSEFDSLCLDHHGNLWTAGAEGVGHFEDGKLVQRLLPGPGIATFIVVDQDQNVWTGSRPESGIGLVRVNGSGAARLTAAQRLASDEVHTLLEDRNGALWVGTVKGLSQLRDGVFMSYGAPEGLPSTTRGMFGFDDAKHHVWFGADHVTVRSEGPDLKPAAIRAGISMLQEPVQSADPALRGILVTDASRRSLVMNGNTVLPLPSVPLTGARFLYAQRDGTVWRATTEEGLIGYRSGRPPFSYSTRNGLADNNVTAVEESPDGDLWIGTTTALHRLHNGAISKMTACEVVTSIWIDANGDVWAGSQSGLIHVHASTVHTFSQQDGLPLNEIEGVAGDDAGYLWLGTLEGMVRVDKRRLYQIEDGHAGSISPRILGEGDGLRDSEVRQNSVFRSSDGRIWFLTLTSIAFVQPKAVSLSPPPRAFIDSTTVDDLTTPGAGALTIGPGRHRIEFNYTAPNLSTPGPTVFRYMLDGWDHNWIDAGTRRTVSYAGIPSGNYWFRVSASNCCGEWGPSSEAIPIAVQPFFYQRVWFIALCVMLAGATVFIAVRWRIAQIARHLNDRLHERVEERTRIARELHDTLLQGVIGVSMQLYMAEKQVPEDSALKPHLKRIMNRIQAVVEEGRIALQGLRSQAFEDNTLEEALSLAIGELNIPGTSKASLTVAGTARPLNAIVRDDIYKIAREALTNAVRHAGASMISVEVEYTQSAFRLKVVDDGCGIPSQPKTKDRLSHWGIPGMRERAEHIGAQLQLSSDPKTGTAWELLVPARLAHTTAEKKKIEVIGTMRRLFLKTRFPGTHHFAERGDSDV